MHDNELGQTRTNRKVNNLNICRHESKLTRRVIIFTKFMRDSTLFRITEVLFNGKKENGTYEKYKVPDIDDETHGLMHYQAQRTVTDNHV
jgi:hypothetical protein